MDILFRTCHVCACHIALVRDVSAMPDVARLAIAHDRVIAYCQTERQAKSGQKPGIVFLGGLSSDMTGSKAIFLEEQARAAGYGYLRLDYRGHGASSGRFEEGCIGDWADDAYEAITRLTSGAQIIVGSSMGGWISMLLAKRIPERFAGWVGIAPAPDFTEGMWASLSKQQRRELETTGRTLQPNEYAEPYVLSMRLFEDGGEQLVMNTHLAMPFRVRILHGLEDNVVPYSTAGRILAHIDCPDARATLIKHGDHSLSERGDLAKLWTEVEELMQAYSIMPKS